MILSKVLRYFILTLACLFVFNVNAYAQKPYTIYEYKKGIYVIEIDAQNENYELIPYASEELEYNEDIYKKLNAVLSVNAGFFDPKNQKTVSYMVLDGKTVLDPADNESLMNNEYLKPYLDKILNRSEFRILQDKNGSIIYDIAPHNEEIAEGAELIHSIQAGPMLYPELRLEEEFFILVRDGKIKNQSASALKRYARTGIGIKKGKVYIFLASDKAPVTLGELRDITCIWGMEKAMAFDGGGSTSFDSEDLHITSDYSNQGRKIKSFLILKTAENKN